MASHKLLIVDRNGFLTEVDKNSAESFLKQKVKKIKVITYNYKQKTGDRNQKASSFLSFIPNHSSSPNFKIMLVAPRVMISPDSMMRASFLARISLETNVPTKLSLSFT